MNSDQCTSIAKHDPFSELMRHQRAALKSADPSAWFAVVATVGSDGYPCCRTLTIRSIGEGKITFHVNAHSPKIRHLEQNGKVELLFLWAKTLCQVRVRGRASWQQDEQLRNAWRNKPEGSKVADLMHAHQLRQSSVISGRNELLSERACAADRLRPDSEVPATVVTMRVEPDFFEFWVASPEDRMHDRRRYSWQGSDWILEHLVP